MFCPRCGNPNSDDSKFCENCGALLVDNTVSAPEQQAVQPVVNQSNGQEAKPDVVINIPKVDTNKVKNFIREKKAIVLPVAAILLALIVFLAVGSSLSSPEKVVEGYFEALTESDYDAMYNYIALPDSEFIDKEAFSAYMQTKWAEDGNPYQGITNFKVEEVREVLTSYADKDNYSPVKAYTITSVDKLTGSTKVFSISLIEQDTKTLLFFDNYKVSSAEYIARDVKLYVDTPAQVTFDGKALTNPVTDEGYTVYTLDAVFNGRHKVALSGDLYEPYEVEFSIYGDNYTEEIRAAHSMTLKADVLTQLESKAAEDIKTLYTYAFAQKPFSSDIIKTAPSFTELADRYNELVDFLKPTDEGEGVNTIKITEAKMRTGYYGNPYTVSTDESGNLNVSFTMTFSYDYTATSVDYWDEEITKNDRSDDDNVSIKYAYIDGEWVLSHVDECKFYFYF